MPWKHNWNPRNGTVKASLFRHRAGVREGKEPEPPSKRKVSPARGRNPQRADLDGAGSGERRSVSRPSGSFFGGLFTQLALGFDPVAHCVSWQSEIPTMFSDVHARKAMSSAISSAEISGAAFFEHWQCGEAWGATGNSDAANGRFCRRQNPGPANSAWMSLLLSSSDRRIYLSSFSPSFRFFGH